MNDINTRLDRIEALNKDTIETSGNTIFMALLAIVFSAAIIGITILGLLIQFALILLPILIIAQ